MLSLLQLLRSCQDLHTAVWSCCGHLFCLSALDVVSSSSQELSHPCCNAVAEIRSLTLLCATHYINSTGFSKNNLGANSRPEHHLSEQTLLHFNWLLGFYLLLLLFWKTSTQKKLWIKPKTLYVWCFRYFDLIMVKENAWYASLLYLLSVLSIWPRKQLYF